MLKILSLLLFSSQHVIITLAAVEAFSFPSSSPHHHRLRTSNLCSSAKSSNTDDEASSSSSSSFPSRIRYRRAVPDDRLAKKTLVSLIPTSATDQIIILAEDSSKINNGIIAWATIQSLGYAAIPDATSTPSTLVFEDDDNYNDNYYNTWQRREVFSSATDMIESDINEQLWEEFEDDPTPIPNGLASLPWTSEYRAASKGAAKRRERRDEMMRREEQNAKRNRPRIWEMSLERVNDPEWKQYEKMILS